MNNCLTESKQQCLLFCKNGCCGYNFILKNRKNIIHNNGRNRSDIMEHGKISVKLKICDLVSRTFSFFLILRGSAERDKFCAISKKEKWSGSETVKFDEKF